MNSSAQSDDIFGKTGNGTLDFYLSSTANWRDDDIGDLNISVGTGDFDAIYQSALRSKGLEVADTSGHYDWEKFNANEIHFKSSFPQYPMLVAFTDMYQDYILGPKDISNLLGECADLQQIELTYESDLALRKVIYGCNAALQSNSYLIFICD